MSKAVPKEQPAVDGGLFLPSRSARPFFSTGCYMVDRLLGGGWAEEQIVKLRGDSQSGKSLFAVEAAANFLAKYPRGRVRYVDRENAFDEAYVDNLGIDASRFERPDDISTIEDVTSDILAQLGAFTKNLAHTKKAAERAAKKKSKKKASKKKSTRKKASVKRTAHPCDDPMLYIVDSWDGLSDEAELGRDIGDSATYRMEKAKKGQELARRVQSLSVGVPFTLIVVTQNRWKQSKMPGLPAVRSNSGGGWLEFFPTQTIDLSCREYIENTRKGHERKYGRWLQVMSQKNRRAGPQHPVMVPIMFRYGICDLSACVRYLIDEHGDSLMFDTTEAAKKYLQSIWKLDDDRYEADLARARKHAGELFEEVEGLFAPKRQKYGGKK